MFFSGNLAQSSGKATKDYHCPDTSFLVRGGVFPPPTRIKRALAPLIVFSLKSLEDHWFRSKKFAQMVGDILISFWLATTKKDVVKKMLQKNQ